MGEWSGEEEAHQEERRGWVVTGQVTGGWVRLCCRRYCGSGSGTLGLLRGENPPFSDQLISASLRAAAASPVRPPLCFFLVLSLLALGTCFWWKGSVQIFVFGRCTIFFIYTKSTLIVGRKAKGRGCKKIPMFFMLWSCKILFYFIA